MSDTGQERSDRRASATAEVPRRRRHTLPNLFAALLCLFLVLFPKGGIRLFGIPETWGYMLIALSFPLLLPFRIFVHPVRFLRRQIVALVLLIPFWVIFTFAWLRNGTDGYTGLAGAISIVVGLGALPVAFLWIYPGFLPSVEAPLLARWLRWTILAAAIFGIFQFFWRPLVGSFIQVPYLTVNAGDARDFENYKMIARGAFFKLISTYNNGNIYGTATLILLPLFDVVSQRRWQRAVLRAALFLTLSRTVWVGLVADQFFPLIAMLLEQAKTFPVLRLRAARNRLLFIAGAIPIFIALVGVIGYDPRAFLLDQSLGGRSSQIVSAQSFTLLPSVPVTFFTEIIYLSALNMLGLAGLVGMLLIFGGPLLVLLFDKRALRDPFRRAALKGLLIYALIACSDGGINFIPILAFYWFAYMVFLFGFPTTAVASTVTQTSPAGFALPAAPLVLAEA